ncbi:nucleolar complex protein 2 homolog [Acropora palmata]|uniref:nucleolar complex protein 2 homolog n=1 Tax=Acropora palmata TaxID=6131 RepID=UPI003D9FB515
MADLNGKRQLCDMDADEFMMQDFNSEDEEDENLETSESFESEIAHVSQERHKKSRSANHKNQLARLQEKDPEFYKFLKENDKELLDFNDSGSEMDDDDDDDEDDEDGNDDHDYDDDSGKQNEKDSKQVAGNKNNKVSVKKVKHSKGESSDDENDDISADRGSHKPVHDESSEDQQKGAKTLTLQMIKTWQSELEKNSLHALKQALKAFRSAVHGAFDAADNDEPQVKILFKVEGDKVFNSIIQLCLQHVYPVLFHHVKGTHGKSGKRVLPLSNSKWSHVKVPVKHYLGDILQLLKTLAEPSMLCVILRHAQQLVPYYACFPKVAREFIKRSVRMWSRGEEHVRVMAFLGIRNIATLMPSSFLELSAKKLYMDFVKNTKFMSPKAKPVITFMQNSLVEIFSLDVHLTYQHAFVYIRQLAIHLRNAMVRQKKDSYQTVYNWQYIQCLHLWCRIVSEVKSNGVLDPLIYPLVQTVLGAIKLVPAARYYPLKFHCIRSLNMLAEATDTFVPVAPFLLEILESTEFNKKIKLSTAKPTPFTYILKVSKQQLGTKPYLDVVADHIFELLLEYFSVHAHSIAFPEVAFPAIVRLRKFIKTTDVPRYRKLMKQLVDKIEETSTEVTNRRSKVSFSPKDIDEVEQWTALYRQQPNAIVKFYNTWKTIKPLSDQQNGKQEEDIPIDQEDSDEGAEENITKRKRKNPGAESKKVKRKESAKKPKKAVDKRTTENVTAASGGHSNETDADDIVEDFQFSSDDD